MVSGPAEQINVVLWNINLSWHSRDVGQELVQVGLLDFLFKQVNIYTGSLQSITLLFSERKGFYEFHSIHKRIIIN